MGKLLIPENEIARLTAKGYSARQIASVFGVTRRAIEKRRKKAGLRMPQPEPEPEDTGRWMEADEWEAYLLKVLHLTGGVIPTLIALGLDRFNVNQKACNEYRDQLRRRGRVIPYIAHLQ